MKIAFVCVENSGRSQMAQAFARMHGGEGVEAYSAGSKPSGKINPEVVKLMEEVGYDMKDHESTSVDDLPGDTSFDYLVTMGCGDECPWIPAKEQIDWDIPDPKGQTIEQIRRIRDIIEAEVETLLEEAKRGGED